ncbi:MAG: polyprenyl synthetase family protein [Desulfitobacteriaceae bacterium]|nr:polyprenyl synthetase family protein [Desulfitobacteriaceae bacterium]MDI6880099.1 polyprenyl synthetase family protein [Desulfitobacteriaceae bacterium]MDI6912970.1 polyprenyl synthetase family protein [Desulfitobacteriaceae bacterium]
MKLLFKERLAQYRAQVDEYINTISWNEKVLDKSMAYSLTGSGKRIRPVLALAAAEAMGANPEHILPAAAALEMIHTYSLIHDDLPAMDDDDYRRGRLSNHKVFGEGIAILSGDALLTYAFELLAAPMQVEPRRQLQVIKEVADAAGRQGMVLGQVLDLEGEGKALGLQEIEQIHRHKTGALLRVSVRLGGILAGGSEEDIQALSRYAAALGLAFQIKDDILDLESDSLTLGKPIGSDLKRDKATYPSLLGLSGAKAELAAKIQEAIDALQLLGERGRFLRDLADYIQARQH